MNRLELLCHCMGHVITVVTANIAICGIIILHIIFSLESDDIRGLFLSLIPPALFFLVGLIVERCLIGSI